MSRRTERVAKLMQQVIAQIVLEGLSDPRIDPARVSITRVEVADDFTRAKVYVSVMGNDAEQRNGLRALQHAAGRIQERLMDQIRLRCTPLLSFVADVQFKKSITTLALIQKAMQDLRQRDAEREGKPEEPAEPEESQDAADEDEEA